MGRTIGGYIAAVATVYFFGVIFISQGNIASVIALGFDISLAQRLDAIAHDLTHMTMLYLPVVAIAMLIALPVAGLIIRSFPHLRLTGYVLAGVVGLLAMHIIAKAVLDVSAIAATRATIGLVAQGVAGGLGGLLFHLVSLDKSSPEGNKPAP